MTSLFSNFAIERSILAIPHASYNKGSKGTGGAFDLPTQVTINAGTVHMHVHVHVCEVTLDIGYIVIQLLFLMQHILQGT